MGYNNNNAGMHYVWHNHYAQYDDLKFFDELVKKQEKLKKAEKTLMDKKQTEENVPKTNYIEENNSIIKKSVSEMQQHLLTSPAKSVESVYEEACEQIDDLYNALYIYSVKNHKDLQKASACVSEFLKDKSSDGSIDDMLFLSMITKKLGINIGLLSTISEKEVKDTVYRVILTDIEQDSYVYCSKIDDILYLEKEVSLICYDMEDDTRKYYTRLVGAVMNNNQDSLPDIFTRYKVNIYKDSEKEYYLTLKIDGYSKFSIGNYLECYEANVYHEKTGKVADFFEKNYIQD